MKTEIVNNSELNKFFVSIGWEPVAETEKCFVDEDGRRVSYQFLEDHYGEATEENAKKFFDETAKDEEEDWELVSEGKKPFYTR